MLLAISALALPAFGQAGTEPLLQQIGSKLVGAGDTAHASQGNAVAISADGNTAIIGAYSDTAPGSVAIFVNSQGVWTQQGSKLVGTGAVGLANEGYSVAISADGNTALVGGIGDSGAIWVFTRSAGVWTQQGSKLVGTAASGNAHQGWSVAISGDGNTAIVGGPSDGGSTGAVWVFTRSGGVWTQQGSKLVGTGAVGLAAQGTFVALSGDGNTALIGGPFDNSNAGAAWVFTRSAGVWTQQGSKLVGTGPTGSAKQGYSVGLSADGNTALIGGQMDSSSGGAAWAFTRSSGVWSQQGIKLVPSDAAGTAQFGISVALSANGNKAVVGGFTDNSANGAIWAFTRSGSVWTQQGGKVVASDGAEPSLLGYSVGLSAGGGNAIAGGLNDNNGAGAAWIFGTGTDLGAMTATTLIGSPNPATVGQTVTLTATISPVPTGSSLGTVSFYDGGTLLGTGNVNSSGVAAISTTSLPVGANSLTAFYSGNVGFATSTSSAIIQTVTSRTGTTTTLTASPNPSGSGETVTFTATISPAPTGTPTGTVSFYSGSTLLGTATVNSSGVATFTSASLAAGALSITAVYSGNTGFAGSMSSAVVETVNSSFTVTGPPSPVATQQGGSVVIDVTVPPLGGAFDNVVTMSASGLPRGATATFSPPTVTPGIAGAPTVLTIQLAALAAGMVDPHREIPFSSLAFAIGLCGFGLRRKRFSRRCKQVLAFGFLAGTTFMLTTMTACGGGFAAPLTTPPGSYVVTITGTSGSAQASTTVTVVVR
jgi:hypothetical protein